MAAVCAEPRERSSGAQIPGIARSGKNNKQFNQLQKRWFAKSSSTGRRIDRKKESLANRKINLRIVWGSGIPPATAARSRLMRDPKSGTS